MRAKRPTQDDVARLAGVCRATVSLVLSKKTTSKVPISEETRQRVREAADHLGYVPNPVAQMLARGTNAIIGVFTYETGFPIENEDSHYRYLLGIEREASRQDHNVLLITQGRSRQPIRVFARGTNSLLLADGSIILGAYPDREELRRLAQSGYPYICIGRREVPDCDISWVVSDYTPACCEAAKYLLSLGHRRLAFVDHRPETEASQDKLAGCRQAVAATEGAELSVLGQVATEREEAFDRAYRQNVTAFLARDFYVMRELFAVLEALQLQVPRDVSVVALGGGSPSLMQGIRPTHVRIDRERIGELAVRALGARIRGETTAPQHILVPCGFVLGETTAPVAAER